MISVTQNDNIRFCRTPEEQAIVEEEGSDVGPMLRAVNQIADAVKESHPHILIDTFAYINTLPAPRVTKPRDNVVIRICSERNPLCSRVGVSWFRSVSLT